MITQEETKRLKSIDEFCNDLNAYLMKRYGYKTPPLTNNGQLLNSDRRQVRLYLRFNFYSGGMWDLDTFVIAKFGFRDQRKGNGSHFLNFLKEKSKEYGYSKIGIEQALTEGSRAFAIKHNFSEFTKDQFILDLKHKTN